MKILVPGRFLQDHEERALPTPEYRKWRGYFVLDTEDANFAELVDDAKYYANDVDACAPGLKRAARALLAAIERERVAAAALAAGRLS